MTRNIRKPLVLSAQIVVLLAQVAGLAFAITTISLADDASTFAIAGIDPVTDCAVEYRSQMRDSAGVAVSKARHDTLTSLDRKLQNYSSSDARLELDAMGERG
jgi:hypothetical protein